MDLFILLSYLAGIYGSPSQTNYAAGNNFQDSLVRMRTASEFKTSVALDLGDNTQDMALVRCTDPFALLDHFYDSFLPRAATIDDSQLLRPERRLAAYGIDSLMAVELGKDFEATATKIDDVAELVVERA
ncbi:hypothetical protein LA080_009989 [Diaporthe eres]|nr:hypothetical protein LA080_009989 [Diaporthe eres]